MTNEALHTLVETAFQTVKDSSVRLALHECALRAIQPPEKINPDDAFSLTTDDIADFIEAGRSQLEEAIESLSLLYCYRQSPAKGIESQSNIEANTDQCQVLFSPT